MHECGEDRHGLNVGNLSSVASILAPTILSEEVPDFKFIDNIFPLTTNKKSSEASKHFSSEKA